MNGAASRWLDNSAAFCLEPLHAEGWAAAESQFTAAVPMRPEHPPAKPSASVAGTMNAPSEAAVGLAVDEAEMASR